MANFGCEWTYESEIYYSQQYFTGVLGKSKGVASSLNVVAPNVSMTLVMLLASYGTGYAIKKQWCTVKQARVGCCLLLAVTALYPVLLALIPPDSLGSNFTLLVVTLIRGFRGFAYGSYLPNYSHISP